MIIWTVTITFELLLLVFRLKIQLLKRNSDGAWCVSKQSVVNINTFMFRCRPNSKNFCCTNIYIYILYFIQENYNASEALFQTIIYTFCFVASMKYLETLLKYIIVVAQYNMNVLCTLPFFFFFCFTRKFHDKVFSNIHYICSNTRLDLKF